MERTAFVRKKSFLHKKRENPPMTWKQTGGFFFILDIKTLQGAL